MKINATIITVTDAGEHLTVQAQGMEAAAAEYYDLKPITFSVRMIDANRRALYVGRELTIEVKPR